MGALLAGVLSLCLGVAIGVAIKPLMEKVRPVWGPRRMSVCPNCSTPADRFEGVATNEFDTELNLAVRCGNIISESPFIECGFITPRSLLDIPWLRIHGVGGTCSAGQTAWNATCFGRLSPFCSTASVGIETLESPGSADCARHWDDLSTAKNKMWPEATQTITHDPWLMLAKQAQGRHSRVVVAVSDFAGEVARGFNAHDPRYQQLLDADAHLFFVDAASEEKPQLGVFHRFLASLRARRGLVGNDKPIGPIAVCISKCDMLPTLHTVSYDQAVRFISEVRNAGPSDECTALKSIRTRHELVVKHAAILPCVGNLHHRLQAECGSGGFMFFPMTASGWLADGEDTGKSVSLENRAIAPWGVLDPLFCLIHSEGFQFLQK